MDTIFYLACLGGFAYFCRIVVDGLETLADKFGWKDVTISEKERLALIQACRDDQSHMFNTVNQLCGERNMTIQSWSFDKIKGTLKIK